MRLDCRDALTCPLPNHVFTGRNRMSANTISERTDDLVQQAVALRAERKFNCAQAVAYALAEEVGADPEAMYVLSEGFGAGMGSTSQRPAGQSGRDLCAQPAEQRGHRGIGHHESGDVPARSRAGERFSRDERHHHLPRAQRSRVSRRHAPQLRRVHRGRGAPGRPAAHRQGIAIAL